MTDLLTIALLIIVVCNLGVLLLWYRQTCLLRKQPTTDTMIDYLMGVQGSLRTDIKKFARDTDYDFRAIKTRLADEEKDDQREKARIRRRRAKA